MAQTTVDGIEGVQGLVGQHLGHSDWVEITQEQVNQFAEATGDHQWIHVDPERAAKESPFGGPIAHGYLTLSLLPMLAAADRRDHRLPDEASTTAPRRCASRRRCRWAAGCAASAVLDSADPDRRRRPHADRA